METRLVVTMGDPAGIGPEVAVKAIAAEAERLAGRARLVLVGHAGVLERACQITGTPLRLARISAPSEQIEPPAIGLLVPAQVAAASLEQMPVGRQSAAAGRAAVACIDAAIELALAGEVRGIVTAPIHKGAVAAAGYTFPGHTERLAEKAGTGSVMCMVGGGMIVGFVTSHIALRDVAQAITTEAIVRTARAVERARDSLGAGDGPLGVLGLNPHASDGGRFGDEEARLVRPAVETLQAEGIEAVGPLVPDAAFREHRAGRYAALVALYHDQGNIVFKTLAFDEGVNVTLGLPFIRTSPDHGTAFDIAGTGAASASSMTRAIRLAVDLSAPAAKRTS